MPKDERYEAVLKGLAELRARGIRNVEVEKLERWVATIPAPADDARAFEEWKTKAPLEHSGKLEGYRSTLEAGAAGLRTLLAMNGGAAVAMLAFLGNVVTKGGFVRLGEAGVAMLMFVGGVGLVGVSSGARYFNVGYGAAGHLKTALRWNVGAIAAGLLSLTAFFVGGWLSYKALVG